MPDATVYLRMSTKPQVEKRASLDSQRDTCLKLAQERGYGFPEGYVLEEGVSGANLDRPLLTKVRELIKSGQAKALVCYSTDRLARNPIHIAIVAEECHKAGAELLFVTEPLDTSPEGQLIQYVKGFAAQLEREKIKDRTMRGIRARVKAGKLPHEYGKGVYGYRYNPETGWREVCEPEARWVREIYAWLVQEHLSINAICHRLDALGVPTPRGGRRWDNSSVNRMIHNPVYKGVTHCFKMQGGRHYRDPEDWIELPNATPLIVSEATWEAAQTQIGRNLALSRRAAKKDYLLSGYLFCGDCGRRMHGWYHGNRRHYRCSGTNPNACPTGQRCRAAVMTADDTEAWVWEAVSNILRHPDLILAEVERLSDHEAVVLIDNRLADLERGIQATRNEERRLIRLYAYGEIDDDFILKETRRFKTEREGLEEERDKLRARKQEQIDVEEAQASIRELVERVSDNLEGFTYQDKRLALEALRVSATAQPDGSLDLRLALPITLAQPLSCRSDLGW